MTEQDAAELFQAALDLEGEARAEFLDERCAQRPELRARVEALLAADGEAAGFLESPLPLDALLAEADDPATALVGRTIGTYRILDIIAAGGMGVVFEAEQEKPRRRVALKVLKAGLASGQVLRRFSHEAEILGRLRHAGIAQIFEAGVDRRSGNLPYFAMEFVPGALPITEYAESRGLTVRQRLELFAGVCDTVHFGHQQGVIHRDLKPGNILVDDEGRSRIIDFGVARATDADMTMVSRQTDAGQLVGTLRYMSPEQCEGDAGRVDTRADVYALGVVLYELLTGELPYDVTTPSPFDVPRIIREEEPRRISSLKPALKGDVEAIVLKTLEKDCDRRYQSAHSLGQDIRRYLSGEPIAARRHRKWYLLRKTLIRHRIAFGVATAFVLLIAASAVVLGILYRQAETQRRLAESRAAELRTSAYFNTITLAQNAWESVNTPQLKELLGRCPADLRGWEWRFLSRCSDASSKVLAGHRGSVRALALTGDGSRIVSGGWEDRSIKVWNAVTGQVLHTLDGHEHRVGCLACSPTGDILVSGSHDRTLRTWSLATGMPIHVLSGHERVVRCVLFTPDGRLIISSDEGGTLRIWDANSGAPVRTLQHSGVDVPALAVSPDGRKLVSGGADGLIRVWNPADGRLLRTIEAHDHRLMSFAFNRDGGRLYSGAWDKQVKVWETAGGTLLRTIGPHDAEINSVALDPQGTRLAVAGGTTIRIFDTATGKTLRTLLGHEHSVNSALFSPDGRRVFSCSHDGTIRIWNIAEPPAARVIGRHGSHVDAVACSPGGQWIASAGRDGMIRIFERPPRSEVTSIAALDTGVNALAFSPDGRQLAAGGADGSVAVRNVPSGRERLALAGHRGPLCRVAWSPDGDLLATGSLDHYVKFWDTRNGRLLRGIDCGVPVWCLAFSPDGRRLATCGDEDLIRLWAVDSGLEVGSLSGHRGPVHAVCFSPDGKRLVSCGDDWQLLIWDANSGRTLHVLKGHQHKVLDAVFLPGGSRIVSASYDKTLMVWDTTTGQPALTLRGHEYPVKTVAATADGSTIVSGSADRTVRVWEASLRGDGD